MSSENEIQICNPMFPQKVELYYKRAMDLIKKNGLNELSSVQNWGAAQLI